MFDKIKNYWNLSVDELLNKVSWPTWDELRQSSLIVLFTTLLMAVIIYFVDLSLGSILKLIYSFFG
jgi:preprotein translocase subunit SecE